MSISIAKAINELKSNHQWIKKLAIVCIIHALSVGLSVLSSAILSTGEQITPIIYQTFSIIASLYTIGYIVSCGHNSISKKTFELSEPSEKNLVIKGLKAIITYALYSIILVLILGVFFLCIILIATLLKGILTSVAGKLLLSVISIIFTTTLASVFMNISTACYYKNLKIKDALSIKKHITIYKNNTKTSWNLLGQLILLGLLTSIISMLLSITLVGAILIPFVAITAWTLNVILLRQFAEEIQLEKYI